MNADVLFWGLLFAFDLPFAFGAIVLASSKRALLQLYCCSCIFVVGSSGGIILIVVVVWRNGSELRVFVISQNIANLFHGWHDFQLVKLHLNLAHTPC